MTSYRFTPLTNLCDQQVDFLNTRSDNERAALIQTNHKTDNLYKEGFKIPTIVNGRIVKCEVKNRARTEETASNSTTIS